MQYILGAVVLWNLIIAFTYGLDKRNARLHKWRIPESRLIWPAYIFGGVGAFLGMYIFRHKTKKLKFKILIPLGVLVNCVQFYYLFIFLNEKGII